MAIACFVKDLKNTKRLFPLKINLKIFYFWKMSLPSKEDLLKDLQQHSGPSSASTSFTNSDSEIEVVAGPSRKRRTTLLPTLLMKMIPSI